MSRPYKKTPAVVRKILHALENGATRTAAAGKAGVSLASLSRWAEEDAEFAESLTCAEGVAEASMSECLFLAAPSDWRAGESWLKRRRPSDWGDKQTTELTGKDGGAVEVAFVDALARVYGTAPQAVDESES